MNLIERDRPGAGRLTSYLDAEADRVTVFDTLADIEAGVEHGPRRADSRPRPNNAVIVAASVAASVLLLFGLVAATDRGGERLDTASSPAGGLPLDITVSSDLDVVLPQVAVAADPASVPLPAGATLQGLTPTCTTFDNIEFDCATPDYPAPAGFDLTGTTYIIVDESSHVSGGCRALVADGTRWSCYVGIRSVEESIVGEDFLGDWAPKGRTEG